ncbi:MAG: adenosylcobinamide-GDP ribazoletransferase [Chloroflexota bacterium]
MLAAQFLTAVPLPLAVPAEARHLGRSLAFFPLVGVVLGLALAGLDAALRLLLPVSVVSAVVLLAVTLVTGALHLDGLMDACDGIFGGRSPERRLEIMRDSRVGSYGVVAGVLQLLLKYTALTALPAEARGPALVTTLAAGRWAMAGVTWAFPYARPEGLGAAFKAGVTWRIVAVATVFATGAATLALGLFGLALLGMAAALAWLAGRYLTAKLGGLTGDCYGAINEIVESAALLAVLIWLEWGTRG